MAGLMVIGCIQPVRHGRACRPAAPSPALPRKQRRRAARLRARPWRFTPSSTGLAALSGAPSSDKIGRKVVDLCSCARSGRHHAAVLLRSAARELGLIVGACIIGFNFGGNFALFPAATADFFGNKNVGHQLRLGVPGLRCRRYFRAADRRPLRRRRRRRRRAWNMPFIIAGVACIVGALISASVRPPRAKAAVAPARAAKA